MLLRKPYGSDLHRMKTIVVMPAYNAARTLERTVADIPFTHVEEVVLVDDASQDETIKVAERMRSAYPQVVFHIEQLPKNRGYGGNQKECYRIALARGADIIVMLHPDYQYDPRLITHFVDFIRDGYFDVMLGSRIRSRKETLAAGMPSYKYIANRALTLMMNLATGRVLSEWHTGMRAYSRRALESLPLEKFSDDFVFDSQVLLAIAERGYAIGDIPVPCRYFEDASSIDFSRSVAYGLGTVWETAKYLVRTYAQVLTYLVVGGSSVVANLAAYAFLIYVLDIWYIAAAVIAFLVGAVVSFTFHKHATFKERSLERVWKQLALYLGVITANLAINALILYALVDGFGMPKLVGAVISNGVVAVWSFLIFKRMVFVAR